MGHKFAALPPLMTLRHVAKRNPAGCKPLHGKTISGGSVNQYVGYASYGCLATALLCVSFVHMRAESSPAIAEHFPAATWEKVTPDPAEWSVEKLAEANAWSRRIAPTAAVMIIRHGVVVSEWGDTATKSNLHSIRKSLLSALIGIAVDEHRIDLGATMESLGIDDNEPSLTQTEKTATVGDLLKARSGIYHAALYETDAMARERPPRGSHPPGTFWYYNNWDFNTLGTIYEHATGDAIFSALRDRIAVPIGMEDYQPTDGQYFAGADSDHLAYPIRMNARDLARFALLYLHGGRWNDRQIVPSEWVHESTRPHSQVYPERGLGLGYGYLWWTGYPANNGAPTVKVPPETFAAFGAEGQYAFVIPAYSMIWSSSIGSTATFRSVRCRDSASQSRRFSRWRDSCGSSYRRRAIRMSGRT
jgi:CubicO group peptidase (beta-lactamase class C family)